MNKLGLWLPRRLAYTGMKKEMIHGNHIGPAFWPRFVLACFRGRFILKIDVGCWSTIRDTLELVCLFAYLCMMGMAYQ